MSVRIEGSPVYLDASALAKLYLPEAESEELESALLGRRDLLVSDLSISELTSALARRVRDGGLPPPHARRVYTRLLRDSSEGEYQQAGLSQEVHREAERLLFTLGREVPLRVLDALHLALAAHAGAAAFVSFDRRQLAAARGLGTFELVP